MLSLSRLLALSSNWYGVVLYDQKSDYECRFSQFMGLPVLSLKLTYQNLEKAIVGIQRKRYLSSKSVKNLTERQWMAVINSIDSNVLADNKSNRKTIYSHRKKGLDKLNVRNMHEFRCILSGC